MLQNEIFIEQKKEEGMSKKLVVLTGAGISAESGFKTFRESNGLWEEYDVMRVASPEGWAQDPKLVLQFYNERRQQLKNAQPNAAHIALAKAQDEYQVYIITQNVDNLHEKAGSRNVLHLHGELTKARSTRDPRLVYDIGYNDINMGDLCEKGSQLRPHIVWFGEAVPEMEAAAQIASTADLFAVVGTSMVVYPAAGLISYAPSNCPKFVVDPNEVPIHAPQVTVIKEKASVGVPKMLEMMKNGG